MTLRSQTKTSAEQTSTEDTVEKTTAQHYHIKDFFTVGESKAQAFYTHPSGIT